MTQDNELSGLLRQIEVESVSLSQAEQDAIQLASEMAVHSGNGQTVIDEKVNNIQAVVTSDTLNVSQRIRSLSRLGLKTGEIQKALNGWYIGKTGRELRYQHVRNVLLTPVKKD